MRPGARSLNHVGRYTPISMQMQSTCHSRRLLFSTVRSQSINDQFCLASVTKTHAVGALHCMTQCFLMLLQLVGPILSCCWHGLRSVEHMAKSYSEKCRHHCAGLHYPLDGPCITTEHGEVLFRPAKRARRGVSSTRCHTCDPLATD